VYRLNLRTFHWELVKTTGENPIFRDFHSATAIGDCMFIFGGRSNLSGGFPAQAGMGAEFYTHKVHYLVSLIEMYLSLLMNSFKMFYHCPCWIYCKPLLQLRTSKSAK